MNDYIKDYTRARRAVDGGLQRYMVKVYLHMTLGLLITAVAAAAAFTFPPLTNLLFKLDQWGDIVGRTMLGYGLMFAPFCIAIYLSGSFFRSTFTRSRFLLGLYAMLMGMSLAELAFFYTIDSLHKTVLITAFTFGAMSIYGYTTNRDLTSVGSFCMMAIWGLMISAVVNIFFQSDLIHFLGSFIGVIVCIALIAYNTQKLKTLYYEVQETALAEKAALMGAFSLYLSFLNLFVYLLRFLGAQKRRD
ncbi:Inhibitor of apoptosis-promoting Bax1 [Cardinium endosymbiont of Sogatella furcifera]|uniref:Bax inhibitor-1/YccA family protein n=1 Tax=Cardinium endosymbiont of Sogatella furcifera TaxID=650378 RepID=UPI000E0D7F7C|nr:Bax inhibitor-1/YccA family protein [Cardinium endosymbiont of Sogatella furcifera]AXI24052.1 Inhibitor of apoptosis-promoting Bax1 [Cardinium endosymbiont of Sogatella furcifera]